MIITMSVRIYNEPYFVRSALQANDTVIGRLENFNSLAIATQFTLTTLSLSSIVSFFVNIFLETHKKL